MDLTIRQLDGWPASFFVGDPQMSASVGLCPDAIQILQERIIQSPIQGIGRILAAIIL